MSVYEDLVGEIRRQSASAGAPGIEMAVMKGPTTLMLGDMEITAENLMFAEILLNPLVTKVDGEGHLLPLKAGDTVAVQRMSDALYIVLGKLVSA